MQHKLSIKFRKLRKKGRPKRLGGLGSKQVIEGRPEMKTRVDFDVRSGRSREGGRSTVVLEGMALIPIQLVLF